MNVNPGGNQAKVHDTMQHRSECVEYEEWDEGGWHEEETEDDFKSDKMKVNAMCILKNWCHQSWSANIETVHFLDVCFSCSYFHEKKISKQRTGVPCTLLLYYYVWQSRVDWRMTWLTNEHYAFIAIKFKFYWAGRIKKWLLHLGPSSSHAFLHVSKMFVWGCQGEEKKLARISIPVDLFQLYCRSWVVQ